MTKILPEKIPSGADRTGANDPEGTPFQAHRGKSIPQRQRRLDKAQQQDIQESDDRPHLRGDLINSDVFYLDHIQENQSCNEQKLAPLAEVPPENKPLFHQQRTKPARQQRQRKAKPHFPTVCGAFSTGRRPLAAPQPGRSVDFRPEIPGERQQEPRRGAEEQQVMHRRSRPPFDGGFEEIGQPVARKIRVCRDSQVGQGFSEFTDRSIGSKPAQCELSPENQQAGPESDCGQQ